MRLPRLQALERAAHADQVRIGAKCGQRLGEANWAAFVKYAEGEHKEAFFRALTPASGVLCCEGKLDGAPCRVAEGGIERAQPMQNLS